MKKLLVASVLALAVTMACQQTASAWSEFKFSAGVNFSWVGGGNRFLWGAYRSAPYPGGEDLPPIHGGGYFGGANYYVPAVAPTWQAPAPAAVQAAPAAPAAPTAPASGGNDLQQTYNPYYNAGYQPVGYYYYPSAYYQAPAYWYSR